MTDEELADKYAEEYFGKKIELVELWKVKSYKEAFLAGLQAGRPKWHKVTDGDLPKDENDVLVYSGENWRMCVGRYSPKYKAWEAGCDTIAWCEIPQFKDKE